MVMIFAKSERMDSEVTTKMAAPTKKEDVREDDQYFRVSINEKAVDDISLDIFYKPHTITLLVVCVSGLLYMAFTR